MSAPNPELNYRTVFVSDIHLGMRNCQSTALLDFLKYVECQNLYLVGDIVDFWKVRRGPYWPQSHNDVLQKLLRKSRKGTRVIFIPGNHDDALREYAGMNFGGVEIRRDAIHEAADGKRYLILHGDEFDVVVRYARWLAFLGDRSYDAALALNVPLNFARRLLGLGHWSLSAFLKHKVKSAVNYIGEFEDALAGEARRRDAQGLICGHIHHANERTIDGIHYLNCGDWVESCTAIGERFDGKFEIIRWKEHLAARASQAPSGRWFIEAA
ncbi:UDP-2,3-diacylglucosamine diphosphatase [Hyphomicrobium sp.]|uniref:UDP-2,3-diacylglucosamine diphosphatase n=1 Tax=Hyphomicrobium sp. TaxID=82 RepID=UPI0039E4F444